MDLGECTECFFYNFMYFQNIPRLFLRTGSQKGLQTPIPKTIDKPPMKFFSKTLTFQTDQNNLLDLEPQLMGEIQEFDFFSVIDLTQKSQEWVEESGVKNGLLTVQSLHTTCVISINELDEPCLLGDINKVLREFVPKTKAYLHNGPIRTKNLCADDHKCDRNADAHIKAFLYGSPSQTVIISDGQPVWGKWQRLCMIDFDGPRERQMRVQVLGD